MYACECNESTTQLIEPIKDVCLHLSKLAVLAHCQLSFEGLLPLCMVQLGTPGKARQHWYR